MNTAIFVFFISVLMAAVPMAARQVLDVPEYSLSVDAKSLEKLDSNPWANEYVPAVFTVQGADYACEVRYRGGSTRGAPKKSWRIKFRNPDNPFGAEKINLTAQYYDKSLLRNYVAMKLYEHLGQPAPDVRHVTLYLNNQYAGVYVEVENVDEKFFARRSLHVDALFKGENHAARFVPLPDEISYPATWEQEIGNALSYRELMQMLSALMYLPDEQFAAYVGEHFDVQQVLTYFAVEYTLSAHDNITKNYFLYRNADDGRYGIIPWDNDAVLGNDYQGEYDSLGFILSYRGSMFRNNLLLQRMLDVPEFRSGYTKIVQEIIRDGLDYMAELAQSTAMAIRSDVYRDMAKCCSNISFDQSLGDMEYFLAQRHSYLLNTAPPLHIPPQDVSCSHAFAQPGDTVEFRVAATGSTESRFYVDLALDVDFGQPGDSIGFERVILYDDGNHNDNAAGDGMYANSFVLPHQKQTVIPYAMLSAQRHYPAGGLLYLAYQPVRTPAIVYTEAQESDYAQLHLVDAIKVGEEYVLAFVNTSGRALDLSYSAIRSNEPYLQWPLPPGIVIAPKETLAVSTNAPLARQILPSASVAGTMSSPVLAGDMLALLGPDGRVLAEYAVQGVREVEPLSHPMIINEIRYASSPVGDVDGGDWVELYNPGNTAVEMEGWIIRDSEDDHAFVFPAVTVEPHEYIVTCVDTLKFDAAYTSVKNRIGNMDFAFGNNDAIRLFDVGGRLVDVVEYSDNSPWPGLAETEGATLELISPIRDNTVPLYWQASHDGTPGRENSVAGWDSAGNVPAVIISEINYRAPDALDAGDWVELYNPAEQIVDISNWMLTDEEHDHVFRFPAGASIGANSYVVVARRMDRFRAIHPGLHAKQMFGPTGFGFSSDGGEIRLLNMIGELVDSVRYGVAAPWPVLPDAGGTLELRTTAMDNSLPESWTLSSSPVGTPAAANSAWHIPPRIEPAVSMRIGPNPVQDVMAIDITVEEPGALAIELFDVQGRQLATVFNGKSETSYSVLWDASDLPPGWFFLRFWYNNEVFAVKPIVKL